MYRWFLSWRYMVARRTNLIGMIGILVAVGALIMILSIMSGFLEESRRTLRGSLADLIVSPRPTPLPGGRELPPDPEPILEILRSDPRVAAATPQLTWFGTLAQTGTDTRLTGLLMSDPENAERAG